MFLVQASLCHHMDSAVYTITYVYYLCLSADSAKVAFRVISIGLFYKFNLWKIICAYPTFCSWVRRGLSLINIGKEKVMYTG